MAQLNGITKRTVVDTIEIVSDDNTMVLTVDRTADGVVISTRKPHESRWAAQGTKFTIPNRDTTLLGPVIMGHDVGYQMTHIDEVPRGSFTLPDPNPPVDEAALEAERGRCSELDIERAKAANLAEQKENLLIALSIDHSKGLHTTYGGAINSCPSCEGAVSTLYDGPHDDCAVGYKHNHGTAPVVNAFDEPPAPMADSGIDDDSLPF